MKGKNTIIMSQEEACAAMEYYLTNKLFNPQETVPKVTSISQVNYDDVAIRVELQERTQDEKI